MDLLALINETVWAVDAVRFDAIAASLKALEKKPDLGVASSGETRDGGTYTVPIVGLLIPSGADELRAWGVPATGYDEIRRGIAQANADPAIQRIHLAVDSPGGAVSGVHAAADAIAGSAKPVRAHVDGMAASAAYWLASQAREITADRGAKIGSIGAFAVLRDSTGLQENIGIKSVLISSGGVKGAGADGAVSDALRAEAQRGIDEACAAFVADVARGRGESPTAIQAHATGQVWSAAEARARGLIDHGSPKDYRQMDAFALIEKHPQHAALIAGLAKTGAAADAIVAAIAKADADAHVAALTAERDSLLAEKAQHAAAIAKAVEAINAEKARADKAEADFAAIKAIADGGKTGAKIKSDGGESAPVRKVSRADYDKNPSAYVSGIVEKSIVIAD